MAVVANFSSPHTQLANVGKTRLPESASEVRHEYPPIRPT